MTKTQETLQGQLQREAIAELAERGARGAEEIAAASPGIGARQVLAGTLPLEDLVPVATRVGVGLGVARADPSRDVVAVAERGRSVLSRHPHTSANLVLAISCLFVLGGEDVASLGPVPLLLPAVLLSSVAVLALLLWGRSRQHAVVRATSAGTAGAPGTAHGSRSRRLPVGSRRLRWARHLPPGP